jgi:hypothetical protein
LGSSWNFKMIQMQCWDFPLPATLHRAFQPGQHFIFYAIFLKCFLILSTTHRLGELESRRLTDSPSRGVVDSPTHWRRNFSFKNSLADSLTRRVRESFFDYEYLECVVLGTHKEPISAKKTRKSASLPCPFNNAIAQWDPCQFEVFFRKQTLLITLYNI